MKERIIFDNYDTCADVNAFEKGAEWCDVTVRCYLLGECICSAVMQFN
jgi:hypothetical protein